MPAFMPCEAFKPCEFCPAGSTEQQCAEIQRTHGCHRCSKKGCWRESEACTFHGRAPEPHPDAEMGDTVPHMRETRITCTADGTRLEGGLRRVNWWRRYADVRFCVNDAGEFSMGHASGDQCNCLIDTLRQHLALECDIREVRAFVQARVRARRDKLLLGGYLELQHHWEDVIFGLAHVAGREFLPSAYKIVCVDVTFIGHGDTEGTGANILYIARQNANHFVPLVRSDVMGDDDAVSSGSSSSGADSEGSEGAETVASSSDATEADARDEEEAAKAVAAMRALAAAAEARSDGRPAAEVASSGSSVASQGEASDEEAASSAYDSDATDLFHLETEPAATWETPQDKDRRVAHVLAAQMRRHPLVPAQPGDAAADTSFLGVDMPTATL